MTNGVCKIGQVMEIIFYCLRLSVQLIIKTILDLVD